MRNLATILFISLFAGLARSQAGEVSVYVSLDIEHSRAILEDFEKRTGIKVRITADTEANKTVGLVNKIISEEKNPRCDVFWNNEVGQTIRLKNRGLLQAYLSPGATDIPAEFKDAEGYWTGFAARARVIIYNKELMEAMDLPTGIRDLTDERWAGRITMAMPLTGTTLTHAAALMVAWGEDEAKAWLTELRGKDIYWSRGNAMSMRDVGEGVFAWGYTDTDDAKVAEVKGYPTGVIVPDQEEGGLGTLVIPNSVMIVKGARNLDNAKKMVDYILSREVEQRLASGRTAQIPLHPGVEAPAGVLRLEDVNEMKVDWVQVGDMIEKNGEWLHRTFEGGDEHAGEKGRKFLWIVAIVAVVAILIGLGRRSAVAGH